MLRSKTGRMRAGLMLLVALGAVARLAVARATADTTADSVATILDPAGDTLYDAPAFQDIVAAEMTRTASGDFELLMEMAGPVPDAPPLPSPANHEIWWFWGFDLDLTTSPRGYPVAPGTSIIPEFVVYVSWDGTAFTGMAIDRRPLLTGGEAVITPVPFGVDGTLVEAYLPSELIGAVPTNIGWHLRTVDWSGQVGTSGNHIVDGADLMP